MTVRPLKVASATLVANARAAITEIPAAEAVTLYQNASVIFVDLRDVREREREGFIPGSFHCPRGMAEFWVDPQSPYFKDIFAREGRFIFHCASGWRSALTVKTLNDMGFGPTAHIREGFTGWKEAGGPIAHTEPREKA